MTSIDSYDDNRINSPLPTILNTSESEQTASTGDPLLSQQSECSSPPENSKRIPRQARKPSPGLAARLAALGFGSDSSKERQSAAHLAAIGKIPEDQIRYLESIHQLNSAPNIIQRSGRAWSGATAALTPQLTGDSYTSTSSADRKYSDTGSRDRTLSTASSVERAMSTHDELKEIEKPQEEVETTEKPQEVETTEKPQEEAETMERPQDEAEEMDSQKYILPDHTNGNGTKTIPEIRQDHIERDVPKDEPKDETDDLPPPPLPKDSPAEETFPKTPEADPAPSYMSEVDSYFVSNPFRLQRTGSIYTLSRASFASQLAQLTSLQLPDAESLSSKVSAIPTSAAASRALMSAASQIRSWIHKASEVLSGLEADDDVEWAAAGGREGLEEVDNAIIRFEDLINVYLSAIEELQCREDVLSVTPEDLKTVVDQVESILVEWDTIKKTLKGVKNQVETAMEWEELWTVVLGDIGSEIEILSRLIFELEEKRHKSLMVDSADGVDIGELQTIVEETPSVGARLQTHKSRFSLSQGTPNSPGSSSANTMSQDDSSLLALFARMQPLRASLDFLPMRLSTFHSRAEKVFPTACEELDDRRHSLEKDWRRLEADADSLRKELGEDRWVLVFRGAGRQAQKMYESVERSLIKLQEALEANNETPQTMQKKIENYEAKKMHYGPAIERVLSIIERGVKDRLTVNGEILRLHNEMTAKWETLKAEMREADDVVEDVQTETKTQALRDSISSMVSNDRSTVGSRADTPSSSPASSIVMGGMGGMNGTLDRYAQGKNGKSRSSSSTRLPLSGGGRSYSRESSLDPHGGGGRGLTRENSYDPHSSNGRSYTRESSAELRGSGGRRYTNESSTSASSRDRKNLLATRVQSYGSPGKAGSTSSRSGSATPPVSYRSGPQYMWQKPQPRPTIPIHERPRWAVATNVNKDVLGHGLSPLIKHAPSPFVRVPVPPGGLSSNSRAGSTPNTESKIPTRSPLSRDTTISPSPSAGRSRIPGRVTPSPSPGPYSQQVLNSKSPSSRPSLGGSASNNRMRRSSMHPNEPATSSPLSKASLSARPASSLATQRSASSMASSRRTSHLPVPTPDKNSRGRSVSSLAPRRPGSSLTVGRDSPQLATSANAERARRGSSNHSSTSRTSTGVPRWR